MINVKTIFTSVASVLAVSAALGHGVQVQVTFNQETGKLETHQIVGTTIPPGSAAEPVVSGYTLGDVISPLARVYVMPLAPANVAAGNGLYTHPADDKRTDLPTIPAYASGPGITYRYAYQQAAGQLLAAGTTGFDWGSTSNPVSDVTRANLAGSKFGYEFQDGLKKWDGASWVDPAAECQIILNDGNGTSFGSLTTNGSAGGTIQQANPISSINKPSATATSLPHVSVSFRMLGDGTTLSAPTDPGVYLLSLKITSSASYGVSSAAVGSSDPFYFVMYNGVSTDSAVARANAIAAANSIPLDQVQVAPEPAVMSIAALALMSAARRRRN